MDTRKLVRGMANLAMIHGQDARATILLNLYKFIMDKNERFTQTRAIVGSISIHD